MYRWASFSSGACRHLVQPSLRLRRRPLADGPRGDMWRPVARRCPPNVNAPFTTSGASRALLFSFDPVPDYTEITIYSPLRAETQFMHL